MKKNPESIHEPKAKLNPRILLVDSDTVFRKGIVQGLKCYEIVVIDTGNTIEAVELLKGSKIDIVISSTDFSIIDGQTILTRMREAAPDALFLFMAVKEKMKNNPAPNIRWIEKPVKFSQLLSLILEHR